MFGASEPGFEDARGFQLDGGDRMFARSTGRRSNHEVAQ
jgi:hypothetical protein